MYAITVDKNSIVRYNAQEAIHARGKESMDLPQYLSATLKTLRQTRGWSLSRLATETGVSKAMLGQIERNESSPTVATLWKIATGLNVPLSTFITATDASAPQAYDPDQQAMTITPVFPWDNELHFDHFSVTLAPATGGVRGQICRGSNPCLPQQQRTNGSFSLTDPLSKRKSRRRACG